MDPIEELMNEHRVIEKVLDALVAASDRDMPLDFYRKAVEFITHFADGFHHAKEEGELFPMLEEKGIPRRMGPIGVMCEEHEVARAIVSRMRECIEAKDTGGLRSASLEYVALLRSHIQKEDQVLFPMGRGCLSGNELENLRTRFDGTDQARYEEYKRLGDELAAQVGLPA